MLDPLDAPTRLLRLLSLLQVHRDWTGPDLADRLGVSARTVRRDIDRLRLLGYPIIASGGVGGGYQLAAGASLPPLLLDEEEAVAVALGLRTAAGGAVTGIAESSERALAKLDQVLPSRLRHQVATISAAVETAPMLGPTVDPAMLAEIARSVRSHERLRFDYLSQAGSATLREVEAYRLIFSGRRWYLFCFDPAKSDWRTFRVDRMTLRVPGGLRFTPRAMPGEDLGAYFALGNTTNRFQYRAVLTMQGSAKEVSDEVPSTIGVVEPIDEHTCTLRIGSDSLDQLAVWVAAFGFEFTIHEPPELIDHLRVLTARLHRAAWPDA